MKESYTYDATGYKPVRVIGDPTDLAIFFSMSNLNTMQPQLSTSVPEEKQVSAHNRRRYPGGPVSQVAAHIRKYDPVRGINMSTLPGKNFYLEKENGVFPGTTRKKYLVRQFTYVGNLIDLKNFVDEFAIIDCRLRGPSGDAWTINNGTSPF